MTSPSKSLLTQCLLAPTYYECRAILARPEVGASDGSHSAKTQAGRMSCPQEGVVNSRSTAGLLGEEARLGERWPPSTKQMQEHRKSLRSTAGSLYATFASPVNDGSPRTRGSQQPVESRVDVDVCFCLGTTVPRQDGWS